MAEAQGTTFTVNSPDDVDDGTCDVTHCSLREAINAANANSGSDTIAFNISGAGPHTIRPSSALPTITDPVVIDGYTQPGASPNTNGPRLGLNTVLKIELDGSNTGAGAIALIIGGDSTLRGLAINRFSQEGIRSGPANVIEGNFIGTDVTSTVNLGNTFGIVVENASSNTIGGTASGAGNLISGNTVGILFIGTDATANVIQGNFIVTDVTGAAALGNGVAGVKINDAFNNTIGGTLAAARNVISANRGRGVFLTGGASGNLVLGNFIGTDVTGALNLGNTLAGVRIDLGASSNTIGARNVISGNGIGVIIDGAGTTGNLVQENFIGTDPSGTLDRGNFDGGIFIVNGAAGNTIGGTTAGEVNTIAFNGVSGGAAGVSIGSGMGNAILRNTIFSNAGLGIDLVLPKGATANDAGDGDSGPNNLQNFPVLTSAVSGGSTTVEMTLNSTANTIFRVEFFSNSACDPSGNGEGETFLGASTDVTTDASGNASLTITFLTTVPRGHFITGTATDPGNNTSEFSACITVAAAPTPTPTPQSQPSCS